jgi:hypothetical protein
MLGGHADAAADAVGAQDERRGKPAFSPHGAIAFSHG